MFNGARPRPVHIEIPIDVITAPADHVRRKLGALPSRPGPCADAIARAAEMLKGAKRPLVLLGGGCADASAEAQRLVEALDAPTAYTINAKGVLPKGHPLALGCNQAWVPVRKLVLESDVVLAIGTELGETDYDVVFDGNFRIESQLIRIDIDAEQLNRNYPADIAILSDARKAMAALADALGSGAAFNADSLGSQRAAAVRAELDAQWPEAWNGQRKVLETLQQTLPDLIVAGDSTQPVYSGNHLFEATRTRSWFNSATGYGTLGYGLPAAVGAKLAAPDRPVIALIGDGGIQFTLPELASAVEAGAPIIVLLWNNRGYGEIKRYMQNRDIPTIGVDIYTPDFQGLARAFGCNAEKAESLEHLAELLKAAAKADRPTVIEVWEHAEFLQ
ncbi:putative 2-ketoarginine decarboxylase AruI [compost metagenome]